MLWHIARCTRASIAVVVVPGLSRTPGLQPGDLGAAETGGPHVIAHRIIGQGYLLDPVLSPQVTHDLHCPLIGNVGARRVRGRGVLSHGDGINTVFGQQGRHGQPRGAGTNDQHIRGDSHDVFTYTIVFCSSPRPSIEVVTTSPGCKKIPCGCPIPLGVPVKIMSPGYSVRILARCATSSATGKIISWVLPSCAVQASTPWDSAVGPVMTHLTCRFPASSPTSSGVTTAGPNGPNPGNDIRRRNRADGGRSRSVHSTRALPT